MQETAISSKPNLFPDLREIWSYRTLVLMLTWKDIRAHYKQTTLGIMWAVAQPLFMMIVFSLVLGTLAKLPSENVPYPLYTFSGLLPWTLFSAGLANGASCLVYESNLLQKVYFPRMILPLSYTLSPLVNFGIAFVILLGLMLYFGYYPTVLMLMLIPFLALLLMLILGLSLWLGAINVQYRDIGQAVPFVIQVLMLLSPVGYSATSLVPERFQTIYHLLNPLVGIIQGFRWAILGTQPPDRLFAGTIGLIAVILVSGVVFFRYRERVFADVV